MRQASWKEYQLVSAFPLGTSKGTLMTRSVWHLTAWDDERPAIRGIGEAAPFPGHSLEFPADVKVKLIELCQRTDDWEQRLDQDLREVPSVRFAVEQCLRDLAAGGTKDLFPSDFTLGHKAIPINGLIWMDDRRKMLEKAGALIDTGYRCVKLKIGALPLEDELAVLRALRKAHAASELSLRVDANGAFDQRKVRDVLQRLADLEVESIEQPIAAGLYEAMAELCADTPIPIALDEDLIGQHSIQLKSDLLDHVHPQHIVIKPSLVGGWAATREWIDMATERKIGWWVTSALESNIGLNAIAQFTATLDIQTPQGLGTGRVFTNNIPSPMRAENGHLHYRPETAWDLSPIHV